MSDSNNKDIQLNTEQIYADDIEYYLEEYCISRNITDKYDIRPRQWSAALLYIYSHTLKIDNSCIKDSNAFIGYDLDKVSQLVDRYIYLCYDYNQRISIQGFSMFSGIDSNTIYSWKNKINKSYKYIDNKGNTISPDKIPFMDPGDYRKIATNTGISIYQKLIESEYNNLADGIQDRKRNPMNTLPLFNQFIARNTAPAPRQAIDLSEVVESLGISDKLQAITEKKD